MHHETVSHFIKFWFRPARKKGSQGGSSRISKLYKLDAKELDREVQRLTLLKNECLELCPHMGKEDDLGGIEYKWRLKDITCARFQHLVTQMNFRLQEGMGEARCTIQKAPTHTRTQNYLHVKEEGAACSTD